MRPRDKAALPLADRQEWFEAHMRLKVVPIDGQSFSDDEQSVRCQCQAANR